MNAAATRRAAADALDSTDLRWHLRRLPTLAPRTAARALKVSLPALRVWLAAPARGVLQAIIERAVGADWIEVPHEATTEAERGALRAFVRSGGLTGDQRVTGVRWNIFEHHADVALVDGRTVRIGGFA